MTAAAVPASVHTRHRRARFPAPVASTAASTRARKFAEGSAPCATCGSDTDNPEAYQLYLRGRYFWNKRTAAGVKQGLAYFQQAIEKDPAYALAYAGVADSYAVGNGSYLGLTGLQARPQAKAAAMKALQLDDSLAEAHTTLADTYLYFDWDFDKADQEFRRAIAANPNYPTSHQWYSECLYVVGRYDEAVAEARHAQELDPLSPIISGSLGGAYLYSRRLDEAIEQYKKTIQMDPNISMVRSDLAHAYALKKMYPEALAEWQTVITLAGAPAVASAVGEVYRVSGFQAFLQSLLDHLPKDKLTGEHAYDAARLYALLGRKDEALRFLQKTLAARGGQSVYLNCDPVLDSLRSDPGFQALVKKMNFPK